MSCASWGVFRGGGYIRGGGHIWHLGPTSCIGPRSRSATTDGSTKRTCWDILTRSTPRDSCSLLLPLLPSLLCSCSCSSVAVLHCLCCVDFHLNPLLSGYITCMFRQHGTTHYVLRVSAADQVRFPRTELFVCKPSVDGSQLTRVQIGCCRATDKQLHKCKHLLSNCRSTFQMRGTVHSLFKHRQQLGATGIMAACSEQYCQTFSLVQHVCPMQWQGPAGA
jgi:hypothetical protein